MSRFLNQLVMDKTENTDRLHRIIGVFLLVFLAFAYLSHLGYTPLNNQNDEARRALVSLEMILSGDYITPTLNGEIYLNKPPLYNWIIIGWVKLFGDFSMFAFRLQVILATLGMSWAVYHFTKKFTSATVAFFTAFAFATNGRILIYDSFIGLIDTSFSWLVYLQFLLIFTYGEKKKYYHLFLITYLITAAGFLMKGMPALVFQGFTLLTYFIWRKNFKALFHPAHFLGIGILMMITGAYYWTYFSRNDIAPLNLFGNLLTESSKRTPAHFSIKRSVLHFFSFPLELLYHYAPWSLFVLALFNREGLKAFRKNDFMVYSFLVLIVNIFVYWLSPEVYARYLFMFIPLLYSLFFFLFFETKTDHWVRKVVYGITVFMIGILLLTFLVLPFLDLVQEKDALLPRCLGLVLGFSLAGWVALRYRPLHLYALVLAVILFRIGFNFFILEPRSRKFEVVQALSNKIAETTRGKDLYILQDAQIGNFDGMSFYIEKERKQILRFASDSKPGAYYIADIHQLQNRPHHTVLEFTNYLSDSLKLVQFP